MTIFRKLEIWLKRKVKEILRKWGEVQGYSFIPGLERNHSDWNGSGDFSKVFLRKASSILTERKPDICGYTKRK